MATFKAIHTVAAQANGDWTCLPILGCRTSALETLLPTVAANAPVSVNLPDDAAIVEIDLINSGNASALFYMACVPLASVPSTATAPDLTLLAQSGIRRMIPAGSQIIEPRAVHAGEVLVILATGTLDAQIVCHIAQAT